MQKSERLSSLDVLRGFDLFVLIFLGPSLEWLAEHTSSCFTPLLNQCLHVDWVGFRFWDIIMPLFLFMAGASMPWAFAKYQNGAKTYFRIFKRVFLLFIFGMMVQGNLLSFNVADFKYYSNTLQAIGAGYLIASIFLLNFKLRGQIIATALIFIIYWIPVSFIGAYTPTENFCMTVDKLVLGKAHDGLDYTWIWSSLNFGVTVMLGVFSGHIMRNVSDKKQLLKYLSAFGAILILSGLLMSFQMPIIKKIWSSSFTLFSGGICVLIMAIAYYIVDYKKVSKLDWLKIYGMNSIAAYMLGTLVKFQSIPQSLLYGFAIPLGKFYELLITASVSLIVFSILLVMYKSKTFLKI